MAAAEEILAIAREYEAGPLASPGPGKGSFSARLDNETILINPSGLKYRSLSPADLVCVALDGRVLAGHRKPSIDLVFHLAIYRARPDLGGILHTHSPYATALACRAEPVQPMILSLVLMVGGAVEVAPFAFPGSEDLGQKVVQALGSRNAVLLESHGVVAAGRSLEKAFDCAGTVENVAQIQCIAAALGPLHPLDADTVRAGLQMEHGYAQNTPPAPVPPLPRP
jgi:L-fuculose-phosphate aldolase